MAVLLVNTGGHRGIGHDPYSPGQQAVLAGIGAGDQGQNRRHVREHTQASKEAGHPAQCTAVGAAGLTDVGGDQAIEQGMLVARAGGGRMADSGALAARG